MRAHTDCARQKPLHACYFNTKDLIITVLNDIVGDRYRQAHKNMFVYLPTESKIRRSLPLSYLSCKYTATTSSRLA